MIKTHTPVDKYLGNHCRESQKEEVQQEIGRHFIALKPRSTNATLGQTFHVKMNSTIEEIIPSRA